MIFPVRRAVVAACIPLLLVACKKESSPEGAAAGEKRPPATEAKGAAGPGAAAPVAPTPKGPIVKLLDAGQEPRTVLRYALKPGSKDKILMTMSMGMEMDAPGMPATPIKIPAMQLFMDFDILELLPGDKAKVSYALTATDVVDDGSNAMMVAALKPEISRMNGLAGAWVTDLRGFPEQMSVKIPDGVSDQIRQQLDSVKNSIEQMSAPLPLEAVGVGGKWEVQSILAQGGMTLQQTATFEVVKIEGDTLSLKTIVRQSAERQIMNMPGGITAELLSLASTGSGTTTLKLSRLAPVNADVTVNNTTKIQAGGQTVTMKMDMGIQIAAK